MGAEILVTGNFDNDVIGLHNPNHPANKSEVEMIDEPTDLEEAFLLFKSEPTEANEDKMLEMIDHNRKLVKLLINVAKDVDNTYFKNQLKKLY